MARCCLSTLCGAYWLFRIAESRIREYAPYGEVSMSRAFLFTLVFCGLSLVGCSDDSGSGEPTGPCNDRSGTYRVTWVEQSGKCGAMPEQIVTGKEGLDPACTGGTEFSSDNCEANMDITCPGATGYLVTLRGKVTWSVDGSLGTGTIQMLIVKESNGWTECSSVYSLTYTPV